MAGEFQILGPSRLLSNFHDASFGLETKFWKLFLLDQPSQGSRKEFPFPATSLGNSLTKSYLTSHQLKAFFPGKCNSLLHWTTMTVVTLIEVTGHAVSVTSVSFPHRFFGRTGWFSSCQPGLHIPMAAALAISLPNSFIERREEKVSPIN